MRVIYARKRTLRWILIGFIAVVLAATVFLLLTNNRDHISGVSREILQASKNLTQYEIHGDFQPDQKLLSCMQRVDYVNQEKVTLNEIYFHLYPNAFKDKDKVPFSKEEWAEAYPNGFSSGSICIKEVKVEGKTAPYTLSGRSQDILRIPLTHSLKPGKNLRIEMTYTVYLPNSLGRFGYGEYTYNFTNWYPIASVYDDTGWNNDPYYDIGDPFYSDVANYNVVITAPKEQIIASTGSIEENDAGDKRIWTIEAFAVRDFAWLSSDRFQVLSKKVGDVTVYSYYFTKNAGEKALNYGADAIGIYNDYFGKYPYRQFSVVEADFFIGGMEYPNIVLIDKGLYGAAARKWLEFVVVHETAHQWWYGMVGNDEIDEAWLDEALTEYSTVLYYGKRYSSQREDMIFQDMIVNQSYGRLQILQDGAKEPEVIDKPTYQFEDMMIYDSLVYGKGAIMFDELHKQLGDAKFKAFLQTYFRTMKYKNAAKADMLAACKKVTGKDWTPFFDQWLYGKQ